MSLAANLLPATSGLGSIGTTAEGLAFGAVTSAVEDYFNIIPQGMLGAITIQATLEETLEHDMEVTEHPVQSGAAITDHSYLRPLEITLRCGWSNSNTSFLSGAVTAAFTGGSLPTSDYVSGIYSQLLSLQQSRTPFSVTGTLRTYPSMLMTSLSIDRDKDSSSALLCTITCREIFLVSTTTAAVTVAVQTSPQDTQATSSNGTVAPSLATPAPGGSLPLTSVAADNNTYLN